jgi:hypothetical protein
MDAAKDYYAILGVLPSIDEVALAAVYRALLKKYHPDVFRGLKEEAERKTREIIEAYNVLRDPAQRRDYDAARTKAGGGYGSYEQEQKTSHTETNDPIDVSSDWEFVKKYNPDTERIRLRLASISPSLAATFQILVLSTKNHSQSDNLASGLELEFLRRYFGDNITIQHFVRTALSEGRRDVAIEINKAIKILGLPSDEGTTYQFIDRVRKITGYQVSQGPQGPSAPPPSAGSVKPYLLATIPMVLFCLFFFLVVLVIASHQ